MNNGEKRTFITRTTIIISGYLLVLLFIFGYDTAIERVKEQVIFVFILACGFSGLIIGYLNSVFGLNKIWISIILSPGVFVVLLVISVEWDGFMYAFLNEKLMFVSPLFSSIGGIMIGQGSQKLVVSFFKKMTEIIRVVYHN